MSLSAFIEIFGQYRTDIGAALLVRQHYLGVPGFDNCRHGNTTPSLWLHAEGEVAATV
jgi:hypothetical protein